MPYYTKNMVKWLKEHQKDLEGNAVKKGAKDKDDDDYDDDINHSYYTGVSSTVSTLTDDSKNERGKHTKKRKGKNNESNDNVNKNNKKGDLTKQRVHRITPSCVDFDAAKAIVKGEESCLQRFPVLSFDEKRLIYLKNLLRLQVKRIQRVEQPTPALGKSSYSKYDIEWNEPFTAVKGKRCSIYKCKHSSFPDMEMLCKVYDQSNSTIANPNYFKYLRHLGKKHPFIIQTWDIFCDAKQQILVMQEYANRHDMQSYLNKNSSLATESQVCEWARQLHKALDYLGDMGICHRNIKPHYILLAHKDLSVRLTGFYESVVYWNVKKEDIQFYPCIPSAQQNSDKLDFQAPEVFGDQDKEEYDPIVADVWSYGAVLYYALTKTYPYNISNENPNIENEIQENVQKMSISDEGRAFVSALLNTNAMERLSFDRIVQQAWFGKFRQGNVLSSSGNVCSKSKNSVNK